MSDNFVAKCPISNEEVKSFDAGGFVCEADYCHCASENAVNDIRMHFDINHMRIHDTELFE